MHTEQLDQIAARAAAATPGPWEAPRGEPGAVSLFDEDETYRPPLRIQTVQTAGSYRYDIKAVVVPEVQYAIDLHYLRARDEDLAFICAAREDVLALLAEVHRLRALCSAQSRVVEAAMAAESALDRVNERLGAALRALTHRKDPSP